MTECVQPLQSHTNVFIAKNCVPLLPLVSVFSAVSLLLFFSSRDFMVGYFSVSLVIKCALRSMVAKMWLNDVFKVLMSHNESAVCRV